MAEPILRWAGSKKRLLPILSSATPASYRRYIEPFVGSGVLFLKQDEKAAVLGDLNRELIESYEMVRRYPTAIWNRLMAMSQDPDFYYELRNLDSERLGKYDRTARFIYLNRFCFNGVYRTNRAGRFNVARGIGHLYVPSLETFVEFAKRIRQADLELIRN